MEETKKRVYSAIQPSGQLTLGNYLGALKNWTLMQDEYDCIYCVADLHAITVRQNPAEFRKRILETYAMLLAVGVNPEKSLLYIQSHVAAHSQLAWILNCYSMFGEFSRMTQFKDKSLKHADNVNVGLFSYPALMAADILLYQTDFVPIGSDQKQHLEITRTIAERFNNLYSETFVIPEPIIPKTGARIMSLQTPTKKMSKSDENPNGYIALLDSPDDIMRKFKRAITDSDSKVCVGEGKEGVTNLISIYSVVENISVDEVEKRFEGIGYGEFKTAVGESVVSLLKPVQDKFNQYISDKQYLESLYRDSAQKAEYLANKTLSKVMKKVGYIR